MSKPKKPSIRIAIYVDHIASICCSRAKEYESHKLHMRERFPEARLVFTTNREPRSIQASCDIYIIDFGGLVSYCLDQEALDLVEQLHIAIEKFPTTQFLLWSRFTADYYLHANHGRKPPNVYTYPEYTDDFGSYMDHVFRRLHRALGL